MINKQNLWFVTLFSIILVLSIFYISMNESSIQEFIPEDAVTDDTTLVINEDLQAMNELKDILLSETTNATEKNDAYNSLLEISTNKGNEQNIESLISKEFQLDSFVKINSNNVTIVIDSQNHDYQLANNIIRRVNETFKDNKYVTVKFN